MRRCTAGASTHRISNIIVAPTSAVLPDGIEGRRHLDDIAADEVEPVERADHVLRLGGREAADLGVPVPGA